MSYCSTNVIAGILPSDLQIEQTNEIKKLKTRNLNLKEQREEIASLKNKYINLWQEQYNLEETGIYNLIPNIEDRIQNKELKPN